MAESPHATLVRVVCDGPRPFVAGCEFVGGRCVLAAPILRRHVLHRCEEDARAIFRRFGWRASIVEGSRKLSANSGHSPLPETKGIAAA